MQDSDGSDVLPLPQEFFSKESFDFSTVSGWDEFLAERASNGSGRDADGYHSRDLTNYSVMHIPYILRDSAVGEITIRPLGASYSVPPGNLYVRIPNSFWAPSVRTFFVGTGGGMQRFQFDVGGPTPNGEDYWGTVFYVVLSNAEKLPKIPSLSILAHVNRGMATMGSGYATSARIDNGPYTSDNIYSQRLFSPGFFDEAAVEPRRMFPIGQASSARLPGQRGLIPIGSETNALDELAERNIWD